MKADISPIVLVRYCEDCEIAVTVKHHLGEDKHCPVSWAQKESPTDRQFHASNIQNEEPFCRRFAHEIAWVRACRPVPVVPNVKLGYLSHPVSGDFIANIRQAKWWLIYLQEHISSFWKERCVVLAPWLAEARREIDLDETTRAAFMERCLTIVRRCDAFFAVGGRVSEGMRMEMDEARKYGLQVFDLTNLGEIPPGEQCNP